MKRRDFLKVSALVLTGACAARHHKPAAKPIESNNPFDHYFLTILDGFTKNALATAPDYVVCDFPEGTKLKSCCTPSGKTYVSVARMLPPMVEWHTTGRDPD